MAATTTAIFASSAAALTTRSPAPCACRQTSQPYNIACTLSPGTPVPPVAGAGPVPLHPAGNNNVYRTELGSTFGGWTTFALAATGATATPAPTLSCAGALPSRQSTSRLSDDHLAGLRRREGMRDTGDEHPHLDVNSIFAATGISHAVRMLLLILNAHHDAECLPREAERQRLDTLLVPARPGGDPLKRACPVRGRKVPGVGGRFLFGF